MIDDQHMIKKKHELGLCILNKKNKCRKFYSFQSE